MKKALYWYGKAADQGHENAVKAIKFINQVFDAFGVEV